MSMDHGLIILDSFSLIIVSEAHGGLQSPQTEVALPRVQIDEIRLALQIVERPNASLYLLLDPVGRPKHYIHAPP